jgi:hypothetical protein
LPAFVKTKPKIIRLNSRVQKYFGICGGALLKKKKTEYITVGQSIVYMKIVEFGIEPNPSA